MSAWPFSSDKRSMLAKHLICTAVPAVDPVAFVQLCSKGFTPTYSNGLCFITPQIAFERTFVETTTSKPLAPSQLILLAMHVLWHGFKGQAPVVASFVQREHLQTADAFWTGLYACVAWIITPPAIICEAMQVGRPDLQHFVCRAYMQWLHIVKNPGLIDEALSILLAEPSNYCNWSDVWLRATDWLQADGVQGAVSHTNKNLNDCIISRLPVRQKCAIQLNGCATGIHMSRRDRVLLMLRHLFADGWAGNPLPAAAPAVYCKLAAKQPFLFTATCDIPSVPFDELEPMPTV